MARLPRFAVPGFAHHVIQRGNNRQAIFVDDGDRQRFLALLLEHSRVHGVDVHAYVLMDNHFHLLVTPQQAGGLSGFMQAQGRAYVRGFNNRHGRSGTLWDGRYKSTVVQTQAYFLACMVYIDLNPVRAGLVERPQDHLWSSHRHYVGLHQDHLITAHPLYWQLGNTPFSREAAYADLVRAGLSSVQQRAIGEATASGWALGDAEFAQQLQQATRRRVAKAPAGRPKKSMV